MKMQLIVTAFCLSIVFSSGLARCDEPDKKPVPSQNVGGLDSNLVAVPIAVNGWVDHRLFRPLPGIRKDVDVVMVACWGRYKRHHRFFAALRRLREQAEPEIAADRHLSSLEQRRVRWLGRRGLLAPVMDLMKASVPEANTPEEAARILAQNQGEITPDPKGGSYIYGDAYDRDARVYYRLLNRDYEKVPRPSEVAKRRTSPHLHQLYGKLTGNKGW